MNDHDERRFAYYAALFDGKGTIGMRPQPGARSDSRWQYVCRLRIEMADRGTIYRLASTMGAGHIAAAPKRQNRQQMWVWETAARKSVMSILLRLKSYLQIKSLQADLVLDYLQASSLTGKQQDHIYMAVADLKLKKPKNSCNQHGKCELWRDILRRRSPKWFLRTKGNDANVVLSTLHSQSRILLYLKILIELGGRRISRETMSTRITTISEAESAQRRSAVETANASLRISGFGTPARLDALNEEYIAGRIDEDVLQSTVLGWYGIKG